MQRAATNHGRVTTQMRSFSWCRKAGTVVARRDYCWQAPHLVGALITMGWAPSLLGAQAPLTITAIAAEQRSRNRVLSI
ncbi:hypothetical protein NDU88_005792 [Pleurodeles waltl]|uniref:Uncharacterized protein n=1 Tax=Pleurodeles waltl TaxID=8319 RepID=A0AAV7L1X0_PLEWA|nr:hypothetical protein NDU88_005792 [Pleurodeles waltl]